MTTRQLISTLLKLNRKRKADSVALEESALKDMTQRHAPSTEEAPKEEGITRLIA
jgi:hypothetical protein